MGDSTITVCVLLWAHAGQAAALRAYEDQVLALLPDHGARVLQRVRTERSDTEQADEVHILEFPAAAAFDAYLADDRRAALTDARQRAIARTEVWRVEKV
jgi:uncharacterized protein (DUF1330 family)